MEIIEAETMTSLEKNKRNILITVGRGDCGLFQVFLVDASGMCSVLERSFSFNSNYCRSVVKTSLWIDYYYQYYPHY